MPTTPIEQDTLIIPNMHRVKTGNSKILKQSPVSKRTDLVMLLTLRCWQFGSQQDIISFSHSW